MTRRRSRRPAGSPRGGRLPWWLRLLDPRAYLRAAFLLSSGALVGLPLAVDGISLARQVARSPGDATGCRVASVVDGDTVALWCGAREVERARLTGFDTPELFSPACASELLRAQKATWALRAMILGADRLSVVLEGRDRYDRRLAVLFVDGEPASRRMIREGHARAYDGGRRSGWCSGAAVRSWFSPLSQGALFGPPSVDPAGGGE